MEPLPQVGLLWPCSILHFSTLGYAHSKTLHLLDNTNKKMVGEWGVLERKDYCRVTVCRHTRKYHELGNLVWWDSVLQPPWLAGCAQRFLKSATLLCIVGCLGPSIIFANCMLVASPYFISQPWWPQVPLDITKCLHWHMTLHQIQDPERAVPAKKRIIRTNTTC